LNNFKSCIIIEKFGEKPNLLSENIIILGKWGHRHWL